VKSFLNAEISATTEQNLRKNKTKQNKNNKKLNKTKTTKNKNET